MKAIAPTQTETGLLTGRLLLTKGPLGGGGGFGILNNRINLALYKIGPLGHVLCNKRQIVRFYKMPAEAGARGVPAAYGFGSGRDWTAFTEKFFNCGFVFARRGLPNKHNFHGFSSFYEVRQNFVCAVELHLGAFG
jgi:hypothetical protein